MSRHDRKPDAVTESLEAWRSAGGSDERLSPASRDRILRESLRPGVSEPVLARLFLPVRHWVLGAALPVALAALLGLGFWSGTDAPGHGALGPRVASVEVQRQGGEVVFIIDNGGAPHRVLRSTDPRGQDAQPLEGRGREFRDRISDGPDIVFYRID